MHRGGFTRATAAYARARADEHRPTAEGPRSKNHSARAEPTTLDGFNTTDARPVKQQPRDHPLNRCQRGMGFEQRAHGAAIQAAITLRTWRPDRRALPRVQHAKLQRREIGRTRDDASQRIDFAYHRTLGNATNGRVARQLTDLLQRARHQCDRCPRARGGDGRLRARVSTTHDDHVILRLECCAAR